jgi:hypothetical protein
MGTSKIYWFPTSTEVSGRQEIDFGEILSDLQITPYRVVSDAVSIGGAFSRVARRSGMRVRIIHERFADDALAEKLYSLQSHLEAGGAISFAVDSSNTYAAFGSADPSVTFAGSAHWQHPELLSTYGGGGPVFGDVFHVESFGASPRREEVRVQSFNNAIRELTLQTALKYNHAEPLLFRHRDFFPALFWPEGQMSSPILTHDHRISWTLDMTLEVYPAHLRTMADGADQTGPSIVDTLPDPKADDLDSMIMGPLGDIDGLTGGGSGPKHDATWSGASDPLGDTIRMLGLLGY